MVYLPKEKLLIEGDAYTPAAPNAPPPAQPNPFSVNLYENIERLKLAVEQNPAAARAYRAAGRTAEGHRQELVNGAARRLAWLC